MFYRGSRYEPVPNVELQTPDGRTIVCKRMRLVPLPEGELTRRVKAGDRLDRIAHEIYGDAQQFWRLCDANRAMRPDQLVEAPGRVLSVPMTLR
jgi:nucleoid-associated protein YgaU